MVDEEQDQSYKQHDIRPYYNARDLSLVRAKLEKSHVLLASATPSLESYYNVKKKKLSLLTLKERFGKAVYPKVITIDCKKEQFYNNNPNNIITTKLFHAIKIALEKKEQIILLYNRRGYSMFCICGSCGKSSKCMNCDITLTYHKTKNKMICHYCGYNVPKWDYCQYCNSENIKFIGSGIQQVEVFLKKQFKDYNIERLDTDSITSSTKIIQVFSDFEQNKINILIGTKMVAKGLDFKNVTVVGILNADHSLFFPDFRAEENTVQLLCQTIGRAGRHEKKGNVYLQTYNPDNNYINQAQDMLLSSAYQQLLIDRKELNYPPYTRLIKILVSNKEQQQANSFISKLFTFLDNIQGFEILGPSPAPILKLSGMYRYQLLIKTTNIGLFQQVVKMKIFQKIVQYYKNSKIVFDVDPQNIM